MTTAIIIIVIVLLFIIGGIMNLLKHKDFPLPKDYDPKNNPGYQDDDDDTGF